MILPMIQYMRMRGELWICRRILQREPNHGVLSEEVRRGMMVERRHRQGRALTRWKSRRTDEDGNEDKVEFWDD